MRHHGEKDVKIARRSATHAGLAFAGEADAGAVFHASRDVDRQVALFRKPAVAAALAAGVGDDLAAALEAGQIVPFFQPQVSTASPLNLGQKRDRCRRSVPIG